MHCQDMQLRREPLNMQCQLFAMQKRRKRDRSSSCSPPCWMLCLGTAEHGSRLQTPCRLLVCSSLHCHAPCSNGDLCLQTCYRFNTLFGILGMLAPHGITGIVRMQGLLHLQQFYPLHTLQVPAAVTSTLLLLQQGMQGSCLLRHPCQSIAVPAAVPIAAAATAAMMGAL